MLGREEKRPSVEAKPMTPEIAVMAFMVVLFGIFVVGIGRR